MPFLRRIDASRRYTNFGALQEQFEAELAAHFGVPPEQLVTSANGTLALVQALRALDARRGSLCAMPSWTFVATAAAAVTAGLIPYFLDVSRDGWTIAPEDVESLLSTRDVGAVIPVAPFGAPANLAAWSRFRSETGIPVVIDAAAGFDTLARRTEPLGQNPIMVSLHATKVFGIGEGAVLVAPDAATAHILRLQGNFGFSGSREAQVPALNSKLSEYAAAVGLAGMQEWNRVRTEWAQLSTSFARLLGGLDGIRLAPGFGDGSWVSCYGIVELLTQRGAEQVGATLFRSGIETRSWWGLGCHRQPAFRDAPRDPLPVTEDLGHRVLGLPFWRGLSLSEFERVAEVLARALRD